MRKLTLTASLIVCGAFMASCSKAPADAGTTATPAQISGAVITPLNANTATAAQIMAVPSPLTPKKLAHEVDEYRPYKNMEQFERELGKYMKPEEMAELKRYFFVE